MAKGDLIWTDVFEDAMGRGLAITCAVPYRDGAGEAMEPAENSRINIEAITDGTVEGIDKSIYTVLLMVLLVCAMAIVVVVVVSVAFAKRLTTPLTHLIEGVQQISGGDLSTKIDVHTGDEIETLADAFNSMTASMDPAKEVGGDFFMVDDSHLAIVMADVSGKGVPAALFMVIAKTIIKNQSLTDDPLEQVFNRANDQLCENNGEGLFVTAFMGLLDLESGSFTYVNAGHNAPLLRRKGGTYEYLQMDSGFVLAGLMRAGTCG